MVKFTGQRKGILVKNDSNGKDAERVGQSSNSYMQHDNSAMWKHLPVCLKTGFFHGQLVWAWNNGHTYSRRLGFYNAKNKKMFQIGEGFNSFSYDHYFSFEGNWPDWALEAHKTLGL